MDFPDLDNLLFEMVKIPSFSETSGENQMANFILENIRGIDYFVLNKELSGLWPIEGDKLKRNSVWALLKSKRSKGKTIILTGHYDVVDIDDYGDLKSLALQPERLKFAMGNCNIPDNVRSDLDSGRYIFGRGAADMKAGLAIELYTLYRFSLIIEDLACNILFLAVCDEENNSAGMRGALPHLVKLQKEMGLEYVAAYNCEPTDGSIYLGSVGKIMPFFFFLGTNAHIENYSEGLNSILMASCLNTILEGNTAFSESIDGAMLPPPVCLSQRDLCRSYSVTIPAKSISYYNYLTVKKTPEAVMEEMRDVCKKTVSCINNMLKRDYDIKILSVNDIWGEQKEKLNVRELLRDYHGPDDIREKCIYLADIFLGRYTNEGPMIMMGFLPPYYPPRLNRRMSIDERNLNQAALETLDIAKRNGLSFEIKECFPGITDLSYFGIQGEKTDIDCLTDNMPGWGSIYSIDIESLSLLNVPVINFGPLGKDIHKFTERLDTNYSFKIFPDIFMKSIENLMKRC